MDEPSRSERSCEHDAQQQRRFRMRFNMDLCDRGELGKLCQCAHQLRSLGHGEHLEPLRFQRDDIRRELHKSALPRGCCGRRGWHHLQPKCKHWILCFRRRGSRTLNSVLGAACTDPCPIATVFRHQCACIGTLTKLGSRNRQRPADAGRDAGGFRSSCSISGSVCGLASACHDDNQWNHCDRWSSCPKSLRHRRGLHRTSERIPRRP